MTQFADLDTPESFNDLLPSEQDALRMWVRLALKPKKRIGGKFSHSYALKHYAEDALGWYVSNGQLKGAMVAEGYRWEQCEGTRRNPNPNWLFNSQRRCPHLMGYSRWTTQFRCPLVAHRPSRYRDVFPTLCQASADELAAFDALNARAMADREREDQRERDARMSALPILPAAQRFTFAVLCAEMATRGIRLDARAAHAGRLEVDAPRGTLTPDLRAALALHRGELLEAINARSVSVVHLMVSKEGEA